MAEVEGSLTAPDCTTSQSHTCFTLVANFFLCHQQEFNFADEVARKNEGSIPT